MTHCNSSPSLLSLDPSPLWVPQLPHNASNSSSLTLLRAISAACAMNQGMPWVSDRDSVGALMTLRFGFWDSTPRSNHWLIRGGTLFTSCLWHSCILIHCGKAWERSTKHRRKGVWIWSRQIMPGTLRLWLNRSMFNRMPLTGFFWTSGEYLIIWQFYAIVRQSWNPHFNELTGYHALLRPLFMMYYDHTVIGYHGIITTTKTIMHDVLWPQS